MVKKQLAGPIKANGLIGKSNWIWLENKQNTRNTEAFCLALKLNLTAERKIAGITQSRYNIPFCRQFVIYISAPDLTGRQGPAHVFNTDRTGYRCNDMNLSRVAFRS